ncbi:Hypothetical_protein [Hexamita inflata]|nr:Hypothetical protein HINF_LOCUS35290 [Hexamita inflata]
MAAAVQQKARHTDSHNHQQKKPTTQQIAVSWVLTRLFLAMLASNKLAGIVYFLLTDSIWLYFQHTFKRIMTPQEAFAKTLCVKFVSLYLFREERAVKRTVISGALDVVFNVVKRYLVYRKKQEQQSSTQSQV